MSILNIIFNTHARTPHTNRIDYREKGYTLAM